MNNKRQTWISVLRIIAMGMVIYPHLFAYKLVGVFGVSYFSYFVLNPLHVIQCMGAMGVSIFFITSGFLSLNGVGRKKYCARFFKTVIMIIINVFVASMFCYLMSVLIGKIMFSLGNVELSYKIYSFKDWIESGTLYRNLFYLDSVEPVFWFLIPFLFFKIALIILDFIFKGNKRNIVYSFFVLNILGIIISKIVNVNYYISDRFFYMGIIVLGCILNLIESKDIKIKEGITLLLLNGGLMIFDTFNALRLVDDGYIVSAIYSCIIFYVFWLLRNEIKENKVISILDKVSFSFYLLHNSIGWMFIQLFYNYITKGHITISVVISVILDLCVIVVYYYVIQKWVSKFLNIVYEKLKSKRVKV